MAEVMLSGVGKAYGEVKILQGIDRMRIYRQLMAPAVFRFVILSQMQMDEAVPGPGVDIARIFCAYLNI